MHESGYPNFEAAAWHGLLVPARTPQAIVNKLHKDWSSAIMLPDVRKPLVNDIIDPTPSDSPKAFAQFLAAETAKWGALVRETGAKAD